MVRARPRNSRKAPYGTENGPVLKVSQGLAGSSDAVRDHAQKNRPCRAGRSPERLAHYLGSAHTAASRRALASIERWLTLQLRSSSGLERSDLDPNLAP